MDNQYGVQYLEFLWNWTEMNLWSSSVAVIEDGNWSGAGSESGAGMN